MILNLEPPDRGPRNSDPKLWAAWLSAAIGTLLCAQRLQACGLGREVTSESRSCVPPHGAASQADDTCQPCPFGSLHLAASVTLVFAGLAGVLMAVRSSPPAGERPRGLLLLAACGGVGAYALAQATGVLHGIKVDVQVGAFIAVSTLLWMRLEAWCGGGGHGGGSGTDAPGGGDGGDDGAGQGDAAPDGVPIAGAEVERLAAGASGADAGAPGSGGGAAGAPGSGAPDASPRGAAAAKPSANT